MLENGAAERGAASFTLRDPGPRAQGQTEVGVGWSRKER